MTTAAPEPARVTLEDPLPLKTGDRVILREVGRRAVVAGGTVLDPEPPTRGADLRDSLPLLRAAEPTPDARATALLEIRRIATGGALAAGTGGGKPAGAIEVGGTYLSQAAVVHLTGEAIRETLSFHEANPLRPGIPKPSLAEHLGVELAVLEALVQASAEIIDDGPAIRSAEFQAGLDDGAERDWEATAAQIRASGWAVPRRSELNLDAEVVHALLRDGRLVAVEEFAYLPEQLDEMVERVGAMNDGFSVADFRDEFSITRKHAVPLLEWLDRSRVTRREGDRRMIRRSQPGGPEPDDARSR